MNESEVLLGPLRLPGTLAVPRPVQALVLFVHGSGSSRMSPRNRHVAVQATARSPWPRS